MTAEKPLPKLYHLALTKQQLELVVVCTSNMVAIHMAGAGQQYPTLALVATDPITGAAVVSENEKGAQSVAQHASAGISSALRRFCSTQGPTGFANLCDKLTRMFLESLKQEGL